MRKETLKEYNARISRTNDTCVHKITNSYGIVEAYSYYCANRPRGAKYYVSKEDFCKIIRTINNNLRERLINGEEIKFPHRMGELKLIKRKSYFRIEDDKVITNRPISWKNTIKLWYEDEEMEKQRKLVYSEITDPVVARYIKGNALFKNKSYYGFKINRFIRSGLRENNKLGKLEAFIKY